MCLCISHILTEFELVPNNNNNNNNNIISNNATIYKPP